MFDDRQPYASEYGQQSSQPMSGVRDSESLILKMQYISQVLFLLGSGISLSAARIALRELQQFDATPLDEPNPDPNRNPDTDAITMMAQQMEAMQQQITELERRLEDR
ncbi:hypothetical protein [Salicibibacter cibarius]|uniref:hypothetical protein n=1 Tax=Salicibibacter cibarius TaxID=2743000 RepID=UPI001B7D8B56|nr:hypothetical protein [Salicibibacter cibarius]